MARLAFIGTGSLGGMLVRRLITSKAVSPEDVNIINRTSAKALLLGEQFPGIHVYTDYRKIVADSDILFLCVKPLDLPGVLEAIGCVFAEDKIVVSTLLAPTLEDMEKVIQGKVVRIYPSVTQSTGRGVTLLTWGRCLLNQDKERLMPYLEALGKYYILPESLYRAAGDVTSCGPAFMAAMIGALAREAANQGINPKIADEMAVETMVGTALLLQNRNLTFDQLIKEVATPGGCTAEGVKVLNRELPSVMEGVYQATCQREAALRANLQQIFHIDQE